MVEMHKFTQPDAERPEESREAGLQNRHQNEAAGEATGEAILEARHVVQGYGERTVLNDISFSVAPGEVVVVLGASGSGKSTLLRCMNALEPLQSGEILLHGEPITGGAMTLPQLRQKVGMVFQSYDLFPHLTVMENIILAPQKVQHREKEEAKKEALQLLGRVGLEDRADSYPNQLSGGQKQRVAIVRALIMHPEVLLLDEITAALDPEMVHEVLNVVLDLAKDGYTMLIVTHEMGFARAIADRILFLDEGKIAEEAPPEEFFTQPKTDRAQRFLSLFQYAR